MSSLFIPTEILLNICDYVEDKLTILSLNLTCTLISKYIRPRVFENVTAAIRQGNVPKRGALHQPPVASTDIRFLEQIRYITRADIAPLIRSLELVCYEFELPTRQFPQFKQLFHDVWKDISTLNIQKLILRPHGKYLDKDFNTTVCFFETIRGLLTFVRLPQLRGIEIFSNSMSGWPIKLCCRRPDYGGIFYISPDLKQLHRVQINSKPFHRSPRPPGMPRGGRMHHYWESAEIGNWLRTLTNLQSLSLVRLDVEWFHLNDNLAHIAKQLKFLELVHFKAIELAEFLSLCKSLESLVFETMGIRFDSFSWAEVFRCCMALENLKSVRFKQLHYTDYDPEYACNMTKRRVSELKHDLCSPRLEDYHAFVEVHRQKGIKLPIGMKICPQIQAKLLK